MAFYVTVDSDFVDSFNKQTGQFTVTLATPLVFNTNDWKVAVLEYGFKGKFLPEKDLVHITCDLVEPQLICSREERIIFSMFFPPFPGKKQIFRQIEVPQFKRVALPHCAKLTFGFFVQEASDFPVQEGTRLFMALLFDRM